jgi:hypothetical protein
MPEIPVTRKPAKPAAAAALFEFPKFELPKSEFPKFDLPKMDVPEGMREFAEKGVAQTRAAYEKAKATAEEATRVLEETNRASAKALAENNRATLEASRTNFNAAFDWGSRSPRRPRSTRWSKSPPPTCAPGSRPWASRARNWPRLPRRPRTTPPSRSRAASPRRSRASRKLVPGAVHHTPCTAPRELTKLPPSPSVAARSFFVTY